MDEYLAIISNPSWTCRYRGRDTTYKERYAKGAALYRSISKLDAPEIKRQLIALAYEILSNTKSLEYLDNRLKELGEEIAKL